MTERGGLQVTRSSRLIAEHAVSPSPIGSSVQGNDSGPCAHANPAEGASAIVITTGYLFGQPDRTRVTAESAACDEGIFPSLPPVPCLESAAKHSPTTFRPPPDPSRLGAALRSWGLTDAIRRDDVHPWSCRLMRMMTSMQHRVRQHYEVESFPHIYGLAQG